MDIFAQIGKIKSDRSSGASQIARNALQTLRLYAISYKNSNYSKFKENLMDISRRLFEAKPNMAPIQNLIAEIAFQIEIFNEDDLDNLRKHVLSKIDELYKLSIISIEESAEYAAKIVGSFDTLVTCSFSSTVYKTIKKISQKRNNFKLFIAESNIDNFNYGEFFGNSIKLKNVMTKVFSDEKISKCVPKTNCGLIGADSILSDGSIINGTPSYELANAARQYGIPFYSVCETTKVNVLSYFGCDIDLKKGFDVVPFNLITGIITEKGILNLDRIIKIMKQRSKFFKIFDVQ
jgi:translation initiation factor eIF-2B subunit delta